MMATQRSTHESQPVRTCPSPNPHHLAEELASLLADISPDCITAMRRRARHVALTHFSSNEGHVRGLAMVMAARARGCDQPTHMAFPPTARVQAGSGVGGGSLSLRGTDQPRESNLRVRRDVAHGGGAAVCLPPHRQQTALPARVLEQEVLRVPLYMGSTPPILFVSIELVTEQRSNSTSTGQRTQLCAWRGRTDGRAHRTGQGQSRPRKGRERQGREGQEGVAPTAPQLGLYRAV